MLTLLLISLVTVLVWLRSDIFRRFFRAGAVAFAVLTVLVIASATVNLWAVVHGQDNPIWNPISVAGLKYFNGTGVCPLNTGSACQLNLNQSAAIYNLAQARGGDLWILRVIVKVPNSGSDGAGAGTVTVGHDSTAGDANAFLQATTCSTALHGVNLSAATGKGGIQAAGFGAILESGSNLIYTISGTCNGSGSVANVGVAYISLGGTIQ